jgi:hypothetical protein
MRENVFGGPLFRTIATIGRLGCSAAVLQSFGTILEIMGDLDQLGGNVVPIGPGKFTKLFGFLS